MNTLLQFYYRNFSIQQMSFSCRWCWGWHITYWGSICVNMEGNGMEEQALKIVGKSPLEAATTIVEDYELPCGVDENNSDVCHLLLFLWFLNFLCCVFVGWTRPRPFQVQTGWFDIWKVVECLWHWLQILQGLILRPKSLIMKVCNTFYEMFTQLRKILCFVSLFYIK